MPITNSIPRFLRSPVAIAVSVMLLAQGVYFAALPKHRIIQLARPFSQFPQNIGGWQSLGDITIEQEIQDLLKADDIMNRNYRGPAWPMDVNLFIAYFRSQRAGSSPHSPKVCLPGNGWTPSESNETPLTVPGRSTPIVVNRYVVSKGTERSVVMYFYQSNGRVLANEYQAKLYSMFASTRYHRSDAAIVRVVVPVVGDDEAAAVRLSGDFLKAIFPAVEAHLPQ